MKSHPYFWVCNVYLKQLLSFGFYLKNFASHKLTKLLKKFVWPFRPLHLCFMEEPLCVNTRKPNRFLHDSCNVGAD
jgi:hypothetical protein